MAQAFNLTAQINLRAPGNLKSVVSQIKKELGSVTADVKIKIDPKSAKTVDNITQKLRAMDAALISAKNNTDNLNNSLKLLSASLTNTKASSVKINSSLKNSGQTATNTAKSIKQASTAMEEFGKQSYLAVKRFAAFSTVTVGIYALTNAINSGLKAFMNFDKEIIRLQQVTGKGAIGIATLEKEIRSLSMSLGVSSADLLEVASTLAQAGFSAEETRIALKGLAKTELAPSFDNLKDTTEGAIAALRQFGLQAKDVEKALGSINAVAAAFAVESSDIITAIQRTGSVFATSSKGVSEGTDALNEFIAIFTSVRATTRESAETISTGLRTIFTRVQRTKTIDALKAYGVELQDLEGKFVGPYEATKRLSEALNKLDPRTEAFASIVEELGGFRQIGKVIPLIQQFSTAQAALSVAQKGQNSLTDAAALAQKSLIVQLAKVREQFLSLIATVGKSQPFQIFFKLVLGLTSGLISLAGAFKPILPYLAILGSIKGFSAITQFVGGFAKGIKNGGGAKGIGSNIGATVSGAKDKDKKEMTSMATKAIADNTSALRELKTSITSLTSAINNKGGSTTLNAGGRVGFARGGVVPGSGNGDTVPAMLEPGEFVIRKKAVNAIGSGNLHRMNKYAWGGKVSSLQELYPSIGSAFGYEDVLNDRIVDNSNFVEITPKKLSKKDIERWKKSKERPWAKFENLLAYSFGVGKSAGGSGSKWALLDFPYTRSEAKFMTKGSTYNDPDSLKGNNEKTIAAKNYLFEQSTFNNKGNKPNLKVEELEKLNSLPAATVYWADPQKFSSAGLYNSGGAVKLYHGSNTGTNDSVLKSFKEKGALSNIAQGYGQGQGFYLYTEKNKAEQQAKMRIGGGSGFTVAQGDRSGKPMVLTFNEILDPKTYDLDYEIQKNLVAQWLHDNFDKIKDKISPDEGIAGIKDVILKDTSKGIMSSGIRAQTAEGTRTSIYSAGDSDIRQGEILGQIMNRLQSGDPELVNAFESKLFARPLGLALKYVGSSPLKPSNIETFAGGGRSGTSSQDTIPALLTPGEFVINKKAAQKIGYSKLNKMNKADKIQGFNSGGGVGIQRFALGGLSDEERELFDYKASRSDMTPQKMASEIRKSIVEAFKEAKNIFPKQKELRAYSIEAKNKLQEINASTMSPEDKLSNKNAIEIELLDKIKSINPELAAKELQDLSSDLMAGLELGMNIDDIIASCSDLKTKVFDKTVTDSEAYTSAIKTMAEQTGMTVDAMRKLVASTDVAADMLKEQMGKKYGLAGSFAPQMAQNFSNTKFGRNLDVAVNKLDKIGSGITGMIGKVGGAFGGSGEIVSGIITKAFSAGGPIGLLGSAASVLGDQLPNLYSAIDNITGSALGKNATAMGISGALTTGGSYAATGAAVGMAALGPPGALLLGAVGAVVGTLEGFNVGIQKVHLQQTLEKLDKSAAAVDEAFTKLEQDFTYKNLANAEKTSGEASLITSKMRDVSQSNLGWRGWVPTFLGGTSKEIQQENLSTEMQARAKRNTETIALSNRRLTTLGDQELNDRTKLTDNKQIFETSTALEELTRGMLKARGAIIGDTESIDEYTKRAGEANRANIEAIKARAKEEAAINAYITQRKQEGATDDQINKELYHNKAAAIKQGTDLVAKQEKERQKAELSARAIKNVTIEQERLDDLYRRMGASIERLSAELDESIRLNDAYAESLSGNASILGPSRMNEQVINNSSAYNEAEIKVATNQVKNLLGNTQGAQGLGDTVMAAKIVRDQIPTLLRDTEGKGAEAAVDALRDRFSKAGLGGDAIKSVLDDLENNLATQSGGIMEGDIMGKEIVDKLSSTLDAGAKANAKILETWNDGLEKSAKQLEAYNKSLSQAEDLQRKAIKTRTESDLRLKETLGGNLTLDEKNKPFNDELKDVISKIGDRGLTANPADLEQFIRQKSQEQRTLQGELNNANPARAKQILEAQAKNVKQINDANKALELLANSGERAANILDEIKNKQKMAAATTDYTERVLTSDSDQLTEMNKDLRAYVSTASGTATKEDYNSLQFRQRSFKGLESISSMLPENVAGKMKARMTRQMLEQTNPALLNTQIGSTTLGEQLKLAETGSNEEVDLLIKGYKEASQIQADAITAQANLQLTAAQTHYAEMETILKETMDKLNGLVEEQKKIMSDEAATLRASTPTTDDKPKPGAIPLEAGIVAAVDSGLEHMTRSLSALDILTNTTYLIGVGSLIAALAYKSGIPQGLTKGLMSRLGGGGGAASTATRVVGFGGAATSTGSAASAPAAAGGIGTGTTLAAAYGGYAIFDTLTEMSELVSDYEGKIKELDDRSRSQLDQTYLQNVTENLVQPGKAALNMAVDLRKTYDTLAEDSLTIAKQIRSKKALAESASSQDVSAAVQGGENIAWIKEQAHAEAMLQRAQEIQQSGGSLESLNLAQNAPSLQGSANIGEVIKGLQDKMTSLETMRKESRGRNEVATYGESYVTPSVQDSEAFKRAVQAEITNQLANITENGAQISNSSTPETSQQSTELTQSIDTLNKSINSFSNEGIPDSLSLDQKSKQYLDSFNGSVASFGRYVDTLSKLAIPSKIEIIGKYTFDVNITGAAAFDAMKINLKDEIEHIFQPQIDQLHDDLYKRTGGSIGVPIKSTRSSS